MERHEVVHQYMTKRRGFFAKLAALETPRAAATMPAAERSIAAAFTRLEVDLLGGERLLGTIAPPDNGARFSGRGKVFYGMVATDRRIVESCAPVGRKLATRTRHALSWADVRRVEVRKRGLLQSVVVTTPRGEIEASWLAEHVALLEQLAAAPVVATAGDSELRDPRHLWEGTRASCRGYRRGWLSPLPADGFVAALGNLGAIGRGQAAEPTRWYALRARPDLVEASLLPASVTQAMLGVTTWDEQWFEHLLVSVDDAPTGCAFELWVRRTDKPMRLVEVNPTAFSMIDVALQEIEERWFAR